jgi:hypothetical protein
MVHALLVEVLVVFGCIHPHLCVDETSWILHASCEGIDPCPILVAGIVVPVLADDDGAQGEEKYQQDTYDE